MAEPAKKAPEQPAEKREVTLVLNEQEARDVLLALNLRLDALRVARGGFRCPTQWKADQARERVEKLVQRICLQLPGVRRG